VPDFILDFENRIEMNFDNNSRLFFRDFNLEFNLELSSETQSSHQSFSAVKIKLFELNS
jgi:hypothetical protein